MGHRVGVVCDASTGGADAEEPLSKLAGICTLGVHRTPMARGVSPRDFLAVRFVQNVVRGLGPIDILHGHGAKGGAYARLAGRSLKRRRLVKRVLHTPHGGSLHYRPDSLKGRLYLSLERRLAPMGDGIVFESVYAGTLYEAKIGPPPCPVRVIPNGLRRDDFHDIILADDAADFLFIGELRLLKGVDVLLEATALINRSRSVTAVVIGSGPEERALKDLARKLGIEGAVSFQGYVPASLAFVRGRCLVVPSRAESFPYIVLEAAACGVPAILADVGGIPEMTRDLGIRLVAPGNAEELAGEMTAFLDDPGSFLEQAEAFRWVVAKRYMVERMAHDITEFYQELIAA